MHYNVNYAAQYTALTSEGDVTDGSVDYYDFDWGEPIVYEREALPPVCGDGQEGDGCQCSQCQQPQQEESEEPEACAEDKMQNEEEDAPQYTTDAGYEIKEI